jgi:hypothetical protein
MVGRSASAPLVAMAMCRASSHPYDHDSQGNKPIVMLTKRLRKVT